MQLQLHPLPFDLMKEPSAPIISLRDITMRWDNKAILNNINLNIHSGDFLAITGPNGGGKTTLLRILLKLLKPTQGKVVYNSKMLTDRQTAIGYLPQKNTIDSHFPITVTQVIESGLCCCSHMADNAKHEKVTETLELLGLQAHADAPIGTLSGGQLQRALMGRALISRPPVLVLDEPLSYLDKHFEQRTYDILNQLRGKTTIILVSHEMSSISSMANRHLIVDHGIHECTAACHYVPSTCQ